MYSDLVLEVFVVGTVMNHFGHRTVEKYLDPHLIQYLQQKNQILIPTSLCPLGRYMNCTKMGQHAGTGNDR
jgi:hypothetical protein